MASFQVAQFTGAATYSVPIQVPAGPGGLQPSFSLSYNSQAVDSATNRTQASWAGMGWTLTGGGYIERDMHSTSWDVNDDTFDLVLNGVSDVLLPISKVKGSNPTVDYATSNDQFLRIRQHLSNGISWLNGGTVQAWTDTSWWEVWDKTGDYYRFNTSFVTPTGGGRSANYPQYPVGCLPPTIQIWRWTLSWVENPTASNRTWRMMAN